MRAPVITTVQNAIPHADMMEVDLLETDGKNDNPLYKLHPAIEDDCRTPLKRRTMFLSISFFMFPRMKLYNVSSSPDAAASKRPNRIFESFSF